MKTIIKFAIFFSLIAINLYAQNSSISMTCSAGNQVPGIIGTQFIIDIKVGNPVAAANLVGVSADLSWNDTNYVGAVSTSAGPFFGPNALIISQNYSNKIEMGITSTTGGKNGSGIIGTCTLVVKSNGYSQVSFILNNVTGIDGNGNPVTLSPFNNPLLITIGVQSINVTSPSTGVNWIVDSTYQVNWTSSNLQNNVNIRLSTDGGTTFPIILDSNITNDGSQNIITPNFLSTSCRIKVEVTNNPTVFGLNAGNFTITVPSNSSMKMIGPSQVSGQQGTAFEIQIKVGDPINVTNLLGISFNLNWDDTGHIACQSSTAGPFLGPNTLFIGPCFPGRIELGITSTSGGKNGSGIIAICSLQVINAFNGTINFTLTNIIAMDANGIAIPISAVNNPFQITLNEPILNVTSPDSGENWIAGTVDTVKWTLSYFTSNVKIRLSLDGGISYPDSLILAANVINTGSYIDTIPNYPSLSCRIKVESVSNPLIYGINPGNFTILRNSFQLSVNVNDKWNMVSIPGLLPSNQLVTTWWPGKNPNASVFRFFNGEYDPITTAEPGTGYWMKHNGAKTYNTGDEWPASGIQIVSHDPIQAAKGWNLFGGYEDSVTSAITTTPSGLQITSVYKYVGIDPLPTDSLLPGYGYWVKLSGAGFINIPEGNSLMKAKIPSVEGFGKIVINDNSGKSFTLYTVKNEIDLNPYELPPVPPQGIFVRYSSQRYAERLSSTPQGIDLMGVQYPVKVKVEETEIILSDQTGSEIARLKSGEEVELNSIKDKLMISENVTPWEYTLNQNYPNPFNPSTTIQFSLPEDVQNVKLIIYSALGEKVSELVNSGLQAGVYNYPWNADRFASGIYIYQLITDKFVSTKKMILVK